MMVLVGGAFERYLGHEGAAFVNGISVLIKETPQRSFALPPCEGMERRYLSMNQEVVLYPHDHTDALLADPQPPEL